MYSKKTLLSIGLVFLLSPARPQVDDLAMHVAGDVAHFPQIIHGLLPYVPVFGRNTAGAPDFVGKKVGDDGNAFQAHIAEGSPHLADIVQPDVPRADQFDAGNAVDLSRPLEHFQR